MRVCVFIRLFFETGLELCGLAYTNDQSSSISFLIGVTAVHHPTTYGKSLSFWGALSIIL